MRKVCLIFGLIGLFWQPFVSAATIVINTVDSINTSSSDGLCNLKEAIDAANNNLASGPVIGECVAGELHPVVDVIEFDLSMLPASILTLESYRISDSLHLKGPSKDLLTISGIAFNRVFDVFNLVSDAEFVFSDLSLSGSRIRESVEGNYGAAIWARHFNGASLTIERVNFLDNYAELGGGALGLFAGFDNTTTIRDSYFARNQVDAFDINGIGGGAIFIGGNQNVTIENSTFENNTVVTFAVINPLDDPAGGAILVRANGMDFTSTLVIEQSTFSGNTAYGVGGAVAMGGPGFPGESSEVTIKHSTFVDNHADFNGDQTGPDSGGGAIYNGSSNGTNLRNNLIAGNSDSSQSSAPDLAGGFLTFGYNLIGNNRNSSTTFPAGQPNINNDFVGQAPATILPLVLPMADNGGPTPSRLLLPDSLAVDQGKCTALSHDQRYHQGDVVGQRTVDQPDINNFESGCDIGAVELDATSENPRPSAVDDVYTLLEGGMLMVSQNDGLLVNDIDDNNLIVVSAGSFDSSASAVQGTVELFADGGFAFSSNDVEAFGSTAFDYSISDLYNHDEGQVELNVLPVNDAPFYIATQSQITAELGQHITILAWATDMSPGPANESDQNLVFVVDVTNAPTGFFVGFPSVDPEIGDLSFELDRLATGFAEITVTLRDDGGTVNGGENSYSSTLFIHASDLIFTNGFEP